jgi:hypothetical protein
MTRKKVLDLFKPYLDKAGISCSILKGEEWAYRAVVKKSDYNKFIFVFTKTGRQHTVKDKGLVCCLFANTLTEFTKNYKKTIKQLKRNFKDHENTN